MTLEEKKAAQTVLMNEITAHIQDQPTMLIDALLADSGFAFLQNVLHRHAMMAQQLAQMNAQLYRAVNALAQTPLMPPGSEDAA